MTPPHFSIVVPTHRRPAALARCLDAICALDYPRDRIEVVVVQDGGVSAADRAARPPLPLDLQVTWLAQPHAGPAAARNLGAAHASHDLLAFTDDDCRPRPGWLRALAARLSASPRSVVGGRTVNALRDSVYSSASQLIVSHLVDHGQRDGAPFLASNNVALPRAAFRAVGGFDTSFALAGGEDRDFCHRCADEGVAMVLAPEAVIDHHHPLTLSSFLRQHHRYGRGALRYRRARAERTGSVRFEAARFYVDLLRAPWRLRETPHRYRVAAMLVASQVANAAGVLAEALSPRQEPEGESVPAQVSSRSTS